MGLLHAGSDTRVPRLDFELSPGCDHACGHCYNVWNADGDDPQAGYRTGQLRGAEFLAMMEKAVRESGAEHITLTGGEPLLRTDALDIVEKACALVPSVQLITNGSHVTPEVVRCLAANRVRSVQLTLLSADRARHDALKGAVCFDDTVRAAVDLLEAGVPVQVCFVSMHENWADLEGVLELCYALGVKAVTYNRMSPTGGAVHHVTQLLPTVEQVEHNLDTLERLGRAWRIRVSTAMPVPPCLIRLERYTWVTFGFCSVGTKAPNITLDALGNVRSCNLSANVLGNITRQSWDEIHASPYFHTFKDQVPDVCRGCAYERTCQGGCKESGYAVFGDLRHPEPFLQMALDPSARETAGGRRQVHTAIPLAGLALSKPREVRGA